MELRQSTSQIIRFGPFTDTDGVLLTALTITQADMQLSKDGGAFAQKSAAGNATHDTDGFYFTTLSTTDSDTTANLRLQVNVSGALIVWENFDVVTQSYHDAKYTGTFNNLGGTAQTGDSYAIVNDSTFGNSALNDSLSQIANVGAAINVTAIPSPNGFTLTTGSEVNNEDDTIPLDGIRHELSDAAGTLDVVYKFDIGGDAAPVLVTFTGVYNGGNDDFTIQGNTGSDASPVWVQIGVLEGTNSSSNVVHTFNMFANMVVSDITGQVQVRVSGTGLTSSSFDTDQVFVSKSSTSRSVGYALGRIWFNSSKSNTSTEPFVDGTGDNPVSAWSSVVTLSNNSAVGLTDFHIINGSTVQLTANSDNYSLFGNNWILDVNLRSIDGAYFEGGTALGVGTSPNGVHYNRFDIGTLSVQKGHFENCGFSSTVTMTLAGNYDYDNGKSRVAAVGGPTFTKTLGQTVTGQWRDWEGSMTLSNIEASDEFTISGNELGDIVLNGVDGTVKILGQYESLTDNRTGSPVLVEGAFKGSDVTDILVDTDEIGVAGVGLTQVSLISTGLDAIVSTATGMVEIAKAIWNRILNKANHNIGQSAGKLTRQLSDLVQIDGAVTDVSPATTGFNTNLTQPDGYFDDSILIFSNGSANAGIGIPISSYLNADGAVTFDLPDDLPVTPVNGDNFVIYAIHVHPISQIQAGLATEAKQDTLQSTVNDIPTNAEFELRTLPSADYFIVSDYTAPDNAGITSNGTAIGLLNDISVAQIFAGGDIDTYSLEESLKLISSACLGIGSGAATSTMLFKAIDGSKTRLTATVDVDGNRLVVVKDATG